VESLFVIVVQPLRESLHAWAQRLMGAFVGSAHEHRLYEAFRFAIGLGAVRLGPDVPEFVALAGLPEAVGDIVRAVVGEHFSHC
jgi:hypothetical protein